MCRGCAGQSRCSRAGSLEISDLSGAQSLAFLARQGVAAKDAARVVDVAGGRLLHLLSAIKVLRGGGSADGDFLFKHAPEITERPKWHRG